MPRNQNASRKLAWPEATEPPCPICNGKDVIESGHYNIEGAVYQCMGCGYWGLDRQNLDNPPELEHTHWGSGQAFRRPGCE